MKNSSNGVFDKYWHVKYKSTTPGCACNYFPKKNKKNHVIKKSLLV